MRKTGILASAALALSAILAAVGVVADNPAPVSPRSYYGDIARQVACKLVNEHVLGRPLDDTISVRAWTNLVTGYDFDRNIFRRGDLESFEPMETRIDDAVKAGDVSFGYEVFRVYTRRLGEWLEFATNLLAKGEFDFSVDEDYRWQRKDAAWPVTVEEQNDLWRKRIKNELVAQLCSHQLDAEKHPSTNAPFTVEAAVTNLLKRYRQYYTVLTEPDEEMVLQRYLSAVTSAFDPHTDYMSPEKKEDFDMDMNLSLCGVGAVLQMDEGALKIREIMVGGPMERDGRIKTGDRIVGVGQGDGPIEDIMYRPMNKSIRKIRGKKGTRVVLEIAPQADPMSRRRVELIRDEIKLDEQAATSKVERVSLNGRDYRLGYIRLPSFYGTMDRRPDEAGFRSSTLDVAREIGRLNAEGVEGFALDLRGNGGGSLREAVMMAGLFLRQGPVVLVRDRSSVQALQIPPSGGAVACRRPMIVLVDRLSASASEILAGVLRDTGRAVVVGDMRTHGKGTVQTVAGIGLDPKFGSIKTTTARFYRINGSSTQVKGVESDVRLPSAWEQLELGEDSLPNALPWSAVESVAGRPAWNLPDFVPELRRLSEERTAKDEKFIRHLASARLAGEISKRRTVPLQYEKRLAMMRADRAVDEKDGDGDDEDDEDSGSDAKGKDRPRRARNQMPELGDDAVYTEAMNVLADLTRLTGGAELPLPRMEPPADWMRFFGGE